MTNKHKIIIPASLFCMALWLYLMAPKALLAQSPTTTTIEEEITNSATIGVPTTSPTSTTTTTATATPTSTPIAAFAKVKIFGWGPINSLVKLNGIAVSEEVTADSVGYFEFTNLSFPTPLSFLSGLLYPELCLTAQDSLGRVTYPTCIPPLSLLISSKDIGPIILPPTLAFSKGIVVENTQSIASGQTTPNTQVRIFLAKKDINSLKVVSEVAAYYLPAYTIESDSKGFFEFSLPTNEVNDWRIFAVTNFQGAASAKSNTLLFQVKSSSYRIVELFEDTTRGFKPSLLAIIIILEFLILIVLGILTFLQNQKMPIKKDIKKVQTSYHELQKRYEAIIKSRQKRI